MFRMIKLTLLKYIVQTCHVIWTRFMKIQEFYFKWRRKTKYYKLTFSRRSLSRINYLHTSRTSQELKIICFVRVIRNSCKVIPIWSKMKLNCSNHFDIFGNNLTRSLLAYFKELCSSLDKTSNPFTFSKSKAFLYPLNKASWFSNHFYKRKNAVYYKKITLEILPRDSFQIWEKQLCQDEQSSVPLEQPTVGLDSRLLKSNSRLLKAVLHLLFEICV